MCVCNKIRIGDKAGLVIKPVLVHPRHVVHAEGSAVLSVFSLYLLALCLPAKYSDICLQAS